MFSSTNCLLTCVVLVVYSSKPCVSDGSPYLQLYIPGEPAYTEVLVRRVNDNMTLVCELQDDKTTPRLYVWNYMPVNGSDAGRIPKIEPGTGASTNSTYTKKSLQLTDSGHYMCSSPPYSVTKFILVQNPGPKSCAHGTFWCGKVCIAAVYVCDGFKDCEHGEDESPQICPYRVCSRPDKLNCSFGRCISESACCRTMGPLCQQPSCCDEYPRYSRQEGFVDVEYQPHEERHAPDDYGFIQSTIYTVTACALIFMIAVVLLVSAICKMHMKRAALRSYAHAERATRQHYSMQYAQTHRYPPCYEASRLLEQEGRMTTPQASPLSSPTRQTPLQCGTECSEPEAAPPPDRGGLARLTSIFSSRYRQVPTQSDVELTNVRSTSLNNSPTRNRTLDNYRSPTYCDLNSTEFFFTNPETGNFGRDLNYMAVDYARPSNIDRVIDQLDRQRLTLQLGRFQLSIPRFGRRDNDRRPDTPNVAEININDLDLLSISNDTYTLNGRTIRLLGANFENYPVLPDGTRPPPYNEAMRCKFFGPPPEYLSREVLNSRVDEEARSNVEMPPGYEELASAANGNSPSGNDNGNGTLAVGVNGTVNENDSEGAGNVNSDGNVVCDCATGASGNDIGLSGSVTDSKVEVNHSNNNLIVMENNNYQSINSIIDNLPAIDSDVNANDTLNGNDNVTVDNGNDNATIGNSNDNFTIGNSNDNVTVVNDNATVANGN